MDATDKPENGDALNGTIATRQDLKDFERRLTVWLGGITLACAALLLAALPIILIK